MKTSEALLAIIRCMGITDELDEALKKTAEKRLSDAKIASITRMNTYVCISADMERLKRVVMHIAHTERRENHERLARL